MKNSVRLLMSVFMVVLILASIAGMRWWGLEGPKPPPGDGRPVLALGIVAGLVGLWVLWSDRSTRHDTH